MQFRIVSKVRRAEIIARGRGVKERRRLQRSYGVGSWRKLKGIAEVKLDDGRITTAEVHWYEAHGIGKKEFKIKRELQTGDE